MALLDIYLALHSGARRGSMYSSYASSAAGIDSRRYCDVWNQEVGVAWRICGTERGYFVVRHSACRDAPARTLARIARHGA